MLAHKSFVLASVVFGAGLISAQSFSLSSSCTDTLKDFLTSPDAACLNPSAFLSFAISSSSQQSIPDLINTWLNGVCTTGSCTNDTLAAVVTKFMTGCSQDLASFGASGVSSDEVISIVQQVYPTARKVVCLKDDNASQLCVTKTLTSVENTIGKLSFTDLSFLNIITDFKNLLANGKSLTCTDCTKEAFTLVTQDFPAILNDVNSEAQDICGASFVDGTSPDGISQTAVSGVFSASQIDSSAARSQSFGFAGTTLLVLSSVFMILG